MGLKHTVTCPLCGKEIKSIAEVRKGGKPLPGDIDKLERFMLAGHICKGRKKMAEERIMQHIRDQT